MKMNGLLWTIACLTVTLPCAPMAMADESRLIGMINDLQNQMAQMQKTLERQDIKIRDLENRQLSVQVAAPSGEATSPMSDNEFNERLSGAVGGANKWLKDLSFKGDLRLRYEGFDHTSGAAAETDARNRFRYRLRYGFEKKINEDMKIGFSMVSGETSGGQSVDPASTNTSFDNNFNFKDIFIEKAYATYSPPFLRKGPIEGVTLTAGKMDNPFEKGSSDMIWDRDVKPEGLIEAVDIRLLDGENLKLNGYFTAGQFVLDEDGTIGGDAELLAYQGGVTITADTPFFERPVDFLSAVSYYNFEDYGTGSNFFIGTTSLAGGNSVCGTSLCAVDFNIVEFYQELAFYPNGLPIRPYFDWAFNPGNVYTPDEDHAFALGVKVGGIAKKGNWEVSYAYKRIEPEAVVGAFNDSDFGLGHGGNRGSVLKLGYALTDKITLNGAAFFVNNLNPGTAGIRDEETRRFQLDLLWKF